LQEKQSQIIFSNPQKAKNRIFKIDGCVVADSVTRRCDYLLYDSNETEHFIELKGKDIKRDPSIVVPGKAAKRKPGFTALESSAIPSTRQLLSPVRVMLPIPFNISFNVLIVLSLTECQYNALATLYFCP
jgi:hypothetical protein